MRTSRGMVQSEGRTGHKEGHDGKETAAHRAVFHQKPFLKEITLQLYLLSPTLHQACKASFLPPDEVQVIAKACLISAISKFKQIWPNFYMCTYMHFYTGGGNPNQTISLQHQDAFYLQF